MADALQNMLAELQPKIVKLAYVFLRKMHKPSPYDLDDLVSEAKQVVIEKMENCQYRENGAAAKSTYILTGVRFHFSNLVKKSYKLDYNPKVAINRKLDRLKRDLTYKIDYPESDSLNIVFELVEKLTDRELIYLSLVLFPPKDFISKTAVNLKKIRVIIREDLEMGIGEELIIRRKIKALLV